MEIFDKIGDAASKTYKFTTEKTSKIAKETKLKMKINEYKGDIKDLYLDIGENVYENILNHKELEMNEIEEKCNQITEITEKIAEANSEILKLNEKRKCSKCAKEISLNAKFCPNCGTEQEDIREVEVVDEPSENAEVVEAEESNEEENE